MKVRVLQRFVYRAIPELSTLNIKGVKLSVTFRLIGLPLSDFFRFLTASMCVRNEQLWSYWHFF